MASASCAPSMPKLMRAERENERSRGERVRLVQAEGSDGEVNLHVFH